MTDPRFAMGRYKYSCISPVPFDRVQYATPEKQRFSSLDSRSPQRFNGLIPQLSQSRQEFSRIPRDMLRNSPGAQLYQKQVNKSSDYARVPIARSSERLLERSFKGLRNSKELKNKYDFCNNSPITWTRTTDSSVRFEMPKQSYSSHLMQQHITKYKLRGRLNTKRIAKGMGYRQSDIFFLGKE